MTEGKRENLWNCSEHPKTVGFGFGMVIPAMPFYKKENLI
jgi:hypothetical protein